MENVPYDFYIEYSENGTVAIPYDEFKEVLESLGFKHEYQEKINEENFFDVWANLNSGVLITIENSRHMLKMAIQLSKVRCV